MNIFHASDVLQFAIRIEENGEKFYRDTVKNIEDIEARAVFSYLAEEEAGHKKVFQQMLNRVKQFTLPESYPGEYLAYLGEYIDGKAVFAQKFQEEKTSKSRVILSAVEFALQREVDSVVYYQEVKRFVPDMDHALIDNIIQEEWQHFTRLSGLKKRYTEEG